jgi:glycosyltransferase involved in cell wall biosynthesis
MVVTIHDLTYLHFKTGRATTLPYPVYHLKQAAYRVIVSQGVRRVRQVIAVSKATRDDIMRSFSIPEDRITVTYEGVDPGLTARVKPSSGSDRIFGYPYFLYVGNAYPHKNLETLIDGFERYLRRSGDRDVRLVLVGPEDHFYGELMKRTRGTGTKDRIVFFGYAGDRALAGLYRFARLSVFPSLAEGFGLPPLEALVSGSPVICSDIPVFREILGSLAGYFDPNDPDEIASALSRRRSKVDGPVVQRHLRRFSWRTMAQTTLSVYEKVHGQ